MPVIIIDEGPGSAAAPGANGMTIQQPLIDLQYFKTPPGIAKIAQIIFGIVTMAIGPPIWLSVVSWLAFFGTFPWFWIYFFSINKKFAINPPWIVLEFYFTAVAFVAYTLMTLVTFITVFYLISAIFGLVTSAAYGVGAYFLFLEWRDWRVGAPGIPK